MKTESELFMNSERVPVEKAAGFATKSGFNHVRTRKSNPESTISL
jgi:hypothetical protein